MCCAAPRSCILNVPSSNLITTVQKVMDVVSSSIGPDESNFRSPRVCSVFLGYVWIARSAGEDAVGTAQGVAIGNWPVNLEITMSLCFATHHVQEAPPTKRTNRINSVVVSTIFLFSPLFREDELILTSICFKAKAAVSEDGTLAAHGSQGFSGKAPKWNVGTWGLAKTDWMMPGKERVHWKNKDSEGVRYFCWTSTASSLDVARMLQRPEFSSSILKPIMVSNFSSPESTQFIVVCKGNPPSSFKDLWIILIWLVEMKGGSRTVPFVVAVAHKSWAFTASRSVFCCERSHWKRQTKQTNIPNQDRESKVQGIIS